MSDPFCSVGSLRAAQEPLIGGLDVGEVPALDRGHGPLIIGSNAVAHISYHDSTTHVLFEPLDFIVRLAALVPKPRVNLTRYHEVHPYTSPLRGSLRLCKSAILPICHGVFAPYSMRRALVTPARRGKGNKSKVPDDGQDQTPTERRVSINWAQRLKRVFTIDIETCRECGGSVKVIACIEDPVLPRSCRRS